MARCLTIPYRWLDDDAVVVVAKVRQAKNISADDADALVGLARDVAGYAELIEAHLQDVVAAYGRHDLDGVIEALVEASEAECVHGDDPATEALMGQLLDVAVGASARGNMSLPQDLTFLGWGLVGEPQDGIVVSGPSGESIDVTGYSAPDYWDDGGEFAGPDPYGIVPVYERADGTQFPVDAVRYPYLA